MATVHRILSAFCNANHMENNIEKWKNRKLTAISGEQEKITPISGGQQKINGLIIWIIICYTIQTVFLYNF